MIMPYEEDDYLEQAPQELVAQVEHIAQKIGFSKDYQVMIPKEPGLQLNPWNKLAVYGINPQNKLPFVLINQEWFSLLSQEQQTFLIARNLMMLSEGASFVAVKLLPWIWALVSFALMALFYCVLNGTPFGTNPVWMKILAISVIFSLANFAFFNALYAQLNSALACSCDSKIVHLTLEKTGQDKQVALATFEAMDAFVKKELADGQAFWKPYENIFANLVDALRKS